MAKYQIWDKTSDVYTPDGKRFTAAQWMDKFGWAAMPTAKAIISDGLINGGCMMEFEATKALYANMGANITDGMTDAEVLAAIEAFEDAPAGVEVSAEERIAAALEYQNLASL